MKVLIIGGGFGGLRVARELSKKASHVDVVVVDRKAYFEVTYATLRTLTEPGFADGAGRVNYSDFLNAEYLQDAVTELKQSEAHLESGRLIEFDYAVIATGSSYPSLPIAKSEVSLSLATRNEEILRAHEELAGSSTIRIVGAGAVGAELAGEIKSKFPNIDVDLYDLGARVLQHLTPKASEIAGNLLKDLGVELHLSTGVNAADAHDVLTYWCGGPKVHTDYIVEPELKTGTGLLRVDPYLRVPGKVNWFVVGDAADLPDAKMGAAATHQGKSVAENLVRLAQGKKRIKPYKAQPFMSLVPLGRKSGVAQFKTMTATWQPVINWKQKDLLIDYALKQVGAR